LYFGVLEHKTRLESGPATCITSDLTPTVVYSYKLLRNDVKPRVHSLTIYRQWTPIPLSQSIIHTCMLLQYHVKMYYILCI